MTRRILGVLAVFALMPGFATLQSPAGPPVPVTVQTPTAASVPVPAEPAQPFDDWLAALIEEADRKGFDDSLIAETLTGLAPLPRVIQADRSQAELNPGLDRYLSTRLTRPVINRGRELIRQNRTLLARIEREHKVQRRFVMAIWGMETRYGRITGREPIFRALATLAWEPRRADYFRNELFDALTMVQRGHIEAKAMTGSWAGAMGQPQFMPSSYLKHAVDFDKDGRIDIWRSVPDALASIANYLESYDWQSDETWGREVRVSPAARAKITAEVPLRKEGCFAIRNMTERRDLEDWAELGVRRADGAALPRADVKASLVTTGDGHTFLAYRNYEAILGYNCAHYYALSVAMLADRY
ncbi:MAG TPA: lytic murein transglycosylase [Gaiellales bacterium]|nr:lytic murein transglycosylase [Gaiellales bacterium]